MIRGLIQRLWISLTLLTHAPTRAEQMFHHCLLLIAWVAQNLGLWVPWLGRKLRFFYGMQRLPDPSTESKWGDTSHCWHLGLAGKECACNAGDLSLIPGLGRSCGEERLPTPVFWHGECHGLYSPRGHKESYMTEHLSPKGCVRSCLDLWWWLLHHTSCPDTYHESTWATPALQCSSRTGQGRQRLREVISCEAERRLGFKAAFEQSKENNSCYLYRLFIGDSLELSVADTNWECEWALLASALPSSWAKVLVLENGKAHT